MAFDVKYGHVTVENDSGRNPLNGTEEPVFVLRASDEAATVILGAYQGYVNEQVRKSMASDMPEDEQADPKIVLHAQGVSQVIARFNGWREKNHSKVKQAD